MGHEGHHPASRGYRLLYLSIPINIREIQYVREEESIKKGVRSMFMVWLTNALLLVVAIELALIYVNVQKA